MGKNNNVGTFTLTPTGGLENDGVYRINSADGFFNLAIYPAADCEGTILGSAKANWGNSESQDLIPEVGTTIATQDPIDGLTITITGGSAIILVNQ
mgnify:CR=1 FL=1